MRDRMRSDVRMIVTRTKGGDASARSLVEEKEKEKRDAQNSEYKTYLPAISGDCAIAQIWNCLWTRLLQMIGSMKM